MPRTLAAYGQWALVTGASSGIGKAMAERLCSEGLNCILVSDEQSELTSVAHALRHQYNGQVLVCVCDLSRPDCLELIDAVRGDIEIDVLVNCASFGMLGAFHSATMDTYSRLVNVAVSAYLSLTYRYLKGMMARNRGAVIFVASVNAFSPVGYSAVYTACKAFELYLGEALYREMQDQCRGVDVLTICPAATRTRFQSKAGTRVTDWAWEPHRVVDVGLRRLGQGPIAVIGWRGHVFRWLAKLLPEKAKLKFASWAIVSNLQRR